jgi:hypothetical protein
VVRQDHQSERVDIDERAAIHQRVKVQTEVRRHLAVKGSRMAFVGEGAPEAGRKRVSAGLVIGWLVMGLIGLVILVGASWRRRCRRRCSSGSSC